MGDRVLLGVIPMVDMDFVIVPIARTLHGEMIATDAKQYQRWKLILSVIGTMATFAWVVALAFWLGPVLGERLVQTVGDNRWLRLFAMAFIVVAGAEVLTLPFDFWSGFILEHRHQLSNQTFLKWMWHKVKAYLVGGIIGSILLAGLYAIIWIGGSWWWLWAAGGYLFASQVLGRIAPVIIVPLFYKVTRLDQADLRERLERLATGTGLTIEGVYRLHLSEETKKANAALAGLGRTRRVLLGDTLLDQFTPEEIEVVFAHELGHHVHRHLQKGIVLGTVLSLAGFFLVDQMLTRLAAGLGYSGLGDPAALPLLILVLGVFGLILAPAQNAVSRWFERQCDRYALLRTANREAYRGVFTKLAQLNKADPDPHPLVVWLFYHHPPISKRLALADEM